MTALNSPLKTCTKCGEGKPVGLFSKQSATSDGLHSYCKMCSKAYNAARHAANPERGKAQSAAWRKGNPSHRSPDRRRAYHAAYSAAHAEQKRASTAAWAKAHPDQRRATAIAYYAANAESLKDKRTIYQSVNLDKIRAYGSDYQKANKEKYRVYGQNRRAKMRENGGVLSSDLAESLFKLQKGLCPCCNKPLGDNYHLDHIMPISRGGANLDSNIQLLRQRCNNQKRAKHPVDFMQERGFLL